MADKYPNFESLRAAEPRNAFAIDLDDRRSCAAVAAPHGGGIEPGTSEIARTIAGTNLSYYVFEGRKEANNRDLHITSSRFDEPKCLALLRSADTVLTVHGEYTEEEVVYLGGLHVAAIGALRAKLEAAGFTTRTHSDVELQGVNRRNICNIGRMGIGIQLELSRGLRRSFFRSLDRDGRRQPTARLHEFSAEIRAILEQQHVLGRPPR